MTCPTCRATVEDGAPRCQNCGTEIGPAWLAPSGGYRQTGQAGPPGTGVASSDPGMFEQRPQEWPSGSYPSVTPDPYATPYPGSTGRPPPSASPAGAGVFDVLVCVALLVACLLIVAFVAQAYGGQPFSTVLRPTWLHGVLAATVIAAYWFGGSAVLSVSPGRRLLAVLAGTARAGTLAAALVPGVVAVLVSGVLGGLVIAHNSHPAGNSPPTTAGGQADGGGGSAGNDVDSQSNSASGAALQQAQAVNALLDSSSGSKANLGVTLGSVCSNPTASLNTIQSVLDARNGQLARAEQLQVDALPTGVTLRQALIDALTDSVNADRAFTAYARHVGEYGCGQDSNYAAGESYSEAAQAAKKSFLNMWNPIANQFGLPARDSTQI